MKALTERNAELVRLRDERRQARAEVWLRWLADEVGKLTPSWQTLVPFARAIFGRHDENPLRREACAILDAWADGRANETATVQRLRRLLVTRAMPEGLAA